MILASMATIPGREEMRHKAICSLLTQVNIVRHIFNPVHDRTDDARKFYLVSAYPDYVLICDDDLIYPPGYAEFMVDAIERHERRAVICLGGRIVRGESTNYYTDREAVPKHDWRIADGKELQVHIPLTGMMAFHTDTIRPIFPDDFPEQNMADILMGILCAKKGVPIMRVSPPKRKWLTLQDTGGDDIWTRYHNDCELQTKLVNETEWPRIHHVNE